MSKKTALQEAQSKYEKEKRGKVIIKVVQSLSDNMDEWDAITEGLKAKYGTVKKGIRELAKKDGIIK